MQKKYELTESGRLGPSKDDDKEVKILNRIARWTDGGVEYEADPRQAERLVSDLGLEDAKRVGTPGVKQTFEMTSRDKPLAEEKHTAFKAIAARGNSLGPDRPEMQYAAKEICRWMAAPSELGVQALKRLWRFLDSHRRLVFEFPFQTADKVDVYSDTDWSGCVRTRKSTSGGCLMLGAHFIKSWSATQGSISLSSGEAEFYRVANAAGIALGYQALLDDLGVKLPVRVWTDSSATICICGRQGRGKLRHVHTKNIWVQQKVRDGSLEIRKVRGDVNPADLFTKHLSSEIRMTELLRLFGCRFFGGRAEGAPQLRREAGVNHAGVLAVEVEESADTVCQDGWAYPAVELAESGGQKLQEAQRNDERVLPHQIRGDLEALFPRAIAGEEEHEEPPARDSLEERGRSIGQRRR